ncbi:MAG TPA: cysteine--tRNA ligase, partial [Candidatus Paceibacterota bacterium]|nr:cysteine--tRNA ligase [Candidatus Paceibacterota bacterium]
VFSDTLARVLSQAGYHVRRVVNITDVGHLVGDGDRGQDKMAVGAEREHTTPEDIANRYTKLYLDDLDDLNIDTGNIQFPRATEYIKEQIALASTLEEKGFAYRLPEGLYFDTERFQGYGKLGDLETVEQEAGARVETVKGKRHPRDFVLWRTADPNDLQQWDSPWGRGNPGWHIECSAMSRALLGPEIDIHTGGQEHIGVHHNNEIAQSEAASGRPFVHYWLHHAHLNIGGAKLAKSTGNAIYLPDVTAKGINPLALRYFFLQAHYRTPLSFSWDALFGAQSALDRLYKAAHETAVESRRKSASSEARIRFLSLVRDDLGTAPALGTLWEALKSEEYSPEEKWGLIEDAEAVFGLNLTNPPVAEALKGEAVPEPVRDMLERREAARKAKDFKGADAIRQEIENSGYTVEDTPDGPVLTRDHV